MASLYFLIPIALVFCALAIKLLLWAIGSGQYDDLDKEAWRILLDDEQNNRGPSTFADHTAANVRADTGGHSMSETDADATNDARGDEQYRGGPAEPSTRRRDIAEKKDTA